jgi:phosphatidylserine decarboxylase
MVGRNTFIIAKEGWKLLAGLAIAFLFFGIVDFSILQFLSFIAFFGVAYLYRNPERVVPYHQNASIVAMMDGTVTAIESLEESEISDGPSYKITVTTGLLDTALLRAPFDGTLVASTLRHGSRLSLSNPQAPLLNAMATLRFQDHDNREVLVKHLVGFGIDAVHVDLFPQQHITQGTRYGLMLSGEHTIYLPGNSRVSVKVGETLRAGESLIAYFS